MPSKNDNDLEKNCEVLVFHHELAAYSNFINDLPVLFKMVDVAEQEDLGAEELNRLLETVLDEYFLGHDCLAAHRDDDIKDILRYYAQSGVPPLFLRFRDREKCDLTKEAKYIFDHSLGGKAKVEYENSIWNAPNSFWPVLFGHRKEYFKRQLSIELEKWEDPDLFRQVGSPGRVQIDRVDIDSLPLSEMKKANPAYWRKLHDAVYLGRLRVHRVNLHFGNQA
jgi:ATP-dependent helicase IRC3